MSKSDLSHLPEEVQGLCQALLARLQNDLGESLYGAYLYGAIAFPESGRIQDIDGHVIITRPLTEDDKHKIHRLYEALDREFPSLAGELDVYYILLEEAAGASPPIHQLRTDIRDESWALHRAHIRAGRFISLYGPDPRNIYPAPTWPDLVSALEGELRYVASHLNEYPNYCVLRLVG